MLPAKSVCPGKVTVAAGAHRRPAAVTASTAAERKPR
jgi:hypothetical protein